jgi:hypothetical protein
MYVCEIIKFIYINTWDNFIEVKRYKNIFLCRLKCDFQFLKKLVMKRYEIAVFVIFKNSDFSINSIFLNN